MRHSSAKFWASAAAALAVGVLGVAVATAATGKTTKQAATTTTAPARPPRPMGTPLTGDVLAKVTAAAVAKAGGTVDAAFAVTDPRIANAAYAALVTKADGTHVRVVLDASYAVLSVETCPPGGPGRRPGGPGHGETPLTGDTAAKAKAAAVAKVGGTADFATTENDSTNAAAAYEVHVTKADGTHVAVILDKDFAVLSVEMPPARPAGAPPPGFRRH